MGGGIRPRSEVIQQRVYMPCYEHVNNRVLCWVLSALVHVHTHTCTCMFNRTVDVRTRVKCLVGLDLRREPLYRR